MLALLLLMLDATPPANACEPLPARPGALPTPPGFCLPPFVSRVAPLSKATREAMRGVSWHEGCPVSLDELRVLTVAHWTLDGVAAEGRLVVHHQVADDMTKVFARLWAERFPVARLEPIEAFGGDDDRSMAANNTSGFNCRRVAGSKRFSRHSWGDAIDLNPLQNPWGRGDDVQPPQGRAWADRTRVEPGVIVEGGPAVEAFEAIGWKWGGRWTRTKDYQHFSRDGR